MAKYHISGGILLTDRGAEEMDLLTNGRVIEAIVPRDAAVSDDYRVIDCGGAYVSAGFVDIHQHGGGGSDYMDPDGDAFLRSTEAHLRHGTTALMPTLLSSDSTCLLRAVEAYKAATRDPRIRAQLIGLHVEGPYISPAQAGAQKPEHIRAFCPDEYRAVAKAAEGHLKRWSVAPEVAGASEFARFAKEAGFTLSIAHTNADLDTVLRAFDEGYRHVTHLYSCMSTITRKNGFRVPGALEAAFLIDGMDVEIIADGCHLPPALLRYVTKFKHRDRIALVTDAMRAAGEGVTESFLGSMDDPLPVLVEDGVAKLCDRSAFAGSVATADRLIRTMVESGTSLEDAVWMMTVNPIRMMRPDLKKGSLRVGYDADICIFDSVINVRTVFVGGERVVG